jgi:hypothetical protein
VLKLQFDGLTGAPKKAESNRRNLIDFLPTDLKVFTTTGHRPGTKSPDGKYTPGFNIEGLAAGPSGSLYVGLRSPLGHDGKAQVLRLEPAAALHAASGSLTLPVAAELNLEGRGIRGMCRDDEKKGYWIIGGIAPDPDVPDPALPNNWAIWFWDGSSADPQKKFDHTLVPSVENPEAIALVPGAKSLLLISDDGGGHPSSYALIPFALMP